MSEPSTAVTRLAPGEVFAGRASYGAACSACERAFLVGEGHRELVCPRCAQATLEPAETAVRADPPELVLPCRIDRAALAGLLTAFVRPVRFAPPELRAAVLTERAVQLWWPVWLVDATVRGHWQGEIGFEHWVESALESFRDGRWVSKEVAESRVRWEPMVGQLERRIDNVRVSALSDQGALELSVGWTSREGAVSFSPEQLGEGVIQVPDQLPESVWSEAVERFRDAAGEVCQQAARAQRIQDFYLQADYEERHWTWLLMPVWATWYTDDQGKRRVILVNGITGNLGGVRRSSPRRGMMWAAVLGALSVATFAVAVIATVFGLMLLPLLIGALVLFAAALVIGGCALWPALWPHRWNREHTVGWASPGFQPRSPT